MTSPRYIARSVISKYQTNGGHNSFLEQDMRPGEVSSSLANTVRGARHITITIHAPQDQEVSLPKIENL